MHISDGFKRSEGHTLPSQVSSCLLNFIELVNVRYSFQLQILKKYVCVFSSDTCQIKLWSL